MSVIHQLSPHVADLIAAGEVVERPCSVVKELLENAVDAGAKHVTVEIQNGGMTFIRLTDDGCGMAPDDAETAFLRHATSKIREAGDLAAITTLGFRGEALAAISSVSRIDLMTRTAQTEGVSLHLDGGRVTERSPAGCPVGTTIIVRDLFYNTPARMKFMKTDSAEGAAVFGAVQRQALSHPEVAIRFLKDGQEQLSTPGDGDLKAAIYCIFGRQFAMELVEVDSHWEQFTLRGYVTKPSATRGNRSFQHFFVGGRPVKSRLLSAALEEAYQNQMMAGRFPGCVLHLDMPASQLDVNVHPAKTEVKFLKERDVFDAVHYGVLGTLNRTPGRPEMKLKVPAGPAAAPVSVPSAPKKGFYQTMDAAAFREFARTIREAPMAGLAPEAVNRVFVPRMPDYPEDRPAAAPVREPEPRQDTLASPVAMLRREEAAPVAAVLEPAAETIPDSAAPEPVQQSLEMPPAPDYRVVGEVLDTYIVVEQAGQVLFLDKHAAHERILFERLKASESEIMAQMLIAPVPVQLDREEAAAVLENAPLLQRFGFEVADFGDGAVALRQIPADLDNGDAEATLMELASQLVEGRHADPAGLRDSLLHTIACKAAIKAGWHTDPEERDALVRQVLERDDIKYCPHGRPVCITLTRSQLERQFKRS